MASNYPGSLDSFDAIASDKKTSDTVGGRTHRQMHNDLGDAIESVQTELGTTPSGSYDTVKARFEAIEGSTGNLLTENQASVETDTTGLSSSGMTISRETMYSLHGTASLRCESTTTGAIAAGIPAGTSNAAPVTAGATYTYTAAVRPINTQTLRLYIVYRGADGSTYVSEALGSEVSCPDSTWTTLQCTLTAPAGAYYAHFWVYALSATVGQRFNLDCLGLWRGAGGTWQLPGVPVPGQGAIKANGAVELPGGDYSPEGAVTANPGSTFLQTSGAATVTGMLSWRKASGTGNTGWVAGAEADTGWRRVAVTGAGWSGNVLLRRNGNTVAIAADASNLTAPAAGQDTITTIDSGFRPGGDGYTFIQTYNLASGLNWVALASATGVVNFFATRSAGNGIALSATYATSDAWPTSLPGSAA